ncbi:hypothetical protein FSPOR_607 [Fusarium sporotrichioides]|uniref:Uncharacterized protein n=1 Tax=Fusarium sporotrichioides TaxID=5514 RepID=A0A395STR8_FUSSP|nr:hypothetical protein FSPOR_607 [Fusarium sporotrichioides]
MPPLHSSSYPTRLNYIYDFHIYVFHGGAENLAFTSPVSSYAETTKEANMSNRKHQYKKPMSLLNRHIPKNALKRDFQIGDIITLSTICRTWRQGTFSALLHSNGNWLSLPIEKDSASYRAKHQKKKKSYVQLSYDGVNKFASTATLPKARQARHPVNKEFYKTST